LYDFINHGFMSLRSAPLYIPFLAVASFAPEAGRSPRKPGSRVISPLRSKALHILISLDTLNAPAAAELDFYSCTPVAVFQTSELRFVSCRFICS
jgi:hypothetical protein